MKNTSLSNKIHLKRKKIKSGIAKPNYRTVSEVPLKAALILSLFSLPVGAVEQGRTVQMFKASDVQITSRSSPFRASLAHTPGPLPFDAEALAAAKATAETNRVMQSILPVPLAVPPGPIFKKGFDGMTESHISPPDPTGAVGTTRYIELSNAGFKIYDKNAAGKGSGSLADLFGWKKIGTFDPFAFDPQVIWDPSKNRFFITGDIMLDKGKPSQQHYLAYVFSKTATPNTAADFCQYALGPFINFPDYPKLGDMKDYVLIGVNTFTPDDTFIESDVFSISKPPAGTTCPDPSTFRARIFGPLNTSLGDLAFTPVPANQIDGLPNQGFVVGMPAFLPAEELVLWRIFVDPTSGILKIENLNGKKIGVAPYTFPQNAPQQGTTNVLDTLDARLTQAVSSINPINVTRGGSVSLWTQHTVSHATQAPLPYYPPSGAEVRWYEINPLEPKIFSSGKLTSTSRFYFNGSISPNRAVNGTVAKFGDTMVLQASGTSTGIIPLGTSTSSVMGQTYPSIYAISKIGTNPQSAVTTVKQGTEILDDFTCALTENRVCRWGDYSGLTPDPTPPATSVRGRLWGNNELGGGLTTVDRSGPWHTWNFIIDP